MLLCIWVQYQLPCSPVNSNTESMSRCWGQRLSQRPPKREPVLDCLTESESLRGEGARCSLQNISSYMKAIVGKVIALPQRCDRDRDMAIWGSAHTHRKVGTFVLLEWEFGKVHAEAHTLAPESTHRVVRYLPGVPAGSPRPTGGQALLNTGSAAVGSGEQRSPSWIPHGALSSTKLSSIDSPSPSTLCRATCSALVPGECDLASVTYMTHAVAF